MLEIEFSVSFEDFKTLETQCRGNREGASSHPCDGIKKQTCIRKSVFGGPEEIRTLDFYNANVALSQLSYRPVNLIIITRDV